MELVPLLPRGFPVPIVAVLHMPPTFTTSLANHLDRISNLSVVEARSGAALTPGTMLVAPGGHHTVVYAEGNTLGVRTNDHPPVNNCRPSIDVLFRSLLQIGNRRALLVVLTGMGSDGRDGVVAMRRAGRCHTLVQDEASSVVWGMPRSVVEAGAADEIVPLANLAGRITELCGGAG
jgi:two-component system chemotaxis response regulator CheB